MVWQVDTGVSAEENASVFMVEIRTIPRHFEIKEEYNMIR
jgi:hypothetical protein